MHISINTYFAGDTWTKCLWGPVCLKFEWKMFAPRPGKLILCSWFLKSQRFVQLLNGELKLLCRHGWMWTFSLHCKGCAVGNSNTMSETGRTGLKFLSQTVGCLVASVDDDACCWQHTFRKGNLRETVGHAAFTWHLKNLWRTREW